ncbi:hypothetical protein Cfor_04252 [Coptotermes formosanus]|uniref:Odorant receptor n=1 Tax=Coptotermes formosanus TaxID=36987 RepID=A0A6L2P875_COPFO|nr:hypothetical protein Cfor_04252 [Coptotermes formosanus]
MKEAGKLLEPKHCVDVNLVLLKWGAVYPFDDFSSSAWANILYKCYKIFNVTLFLFVSVLMPGYFLDKDYSLEEAIEVASIVLTQVRSGMKLMTFVLYRKEIQNLIKALYKNFYLRGKELDARESRIVHEAIKNGRTVSIGYFTLVFITVVSMLLHPLTSTSTDMNEEGTLNHTAGPHRILPFKLWFPKWDATNSPKYEIEYVGQIMITTLEGWFVGSTDAFSATVMILVGCQFDLLCNSLKNINKDACLKSGTEAHENRSGSYSKRTVILDKSSTFRVKAEITGNKSRNNMSDSVCLNKWDENTFHDTDMDFDWKEDNQRPPTAKFYEQTERAAITYIKECIRYHQSLLTYVADVNKCFSTMFFILFLTASLLLCLLGFQVIVVPPKGLKFARVVLHSLCTVFELAFFCWFGSEVMQKSENVYQAAYGCEWQNHSTGLKRLICMIIMRAQHPAAVQAGFFGDLCLPTYSSLMTNAYSYMALLRKLNEGDDA